MIPSCISGRCVSDNYLTHLWVPRGTPQHTNIIKYAFAPVHLPHANLIRSPKHVPPFLSGWNIVISLEHWGQRLCFLLADVLLTFK